MNYWLPYTHVASLVANCVWMFFYVRHWCADRQLDLIKIELAGADERLNAVITVITLERDLLEEHERELGRIHKMLDRMGASPYRGATLVGSGT